MSPWRFTNQSINEDPTLALQDLLAQTEQDTEALTEMLNDFFVECPDAWEQFRAFWKEWRKIASEDEDETT